MEFTCEPTFIHNQRRNKPALLNLPTELRWEIYKHVLEGTTIQEFYNAEPETEHTTNHPFALLRVCKQINAEVEPLANTTLVTLFSNALDKVTSSTPLPPRVRRQITSINFLTNDAENLGHVLDYYPRNVYPSLQTINMYKPQEEPTGTYFYAGQDRDYQLGVQDSYLNDLEDSGITETEYDKDLCHGMICFHDVADIVARLEESGITLRFRCGLQGYSVVNFGGSYRISQCEWAAVRCVVTWNQHGMKLTGIKKIGAIIIDDDSDIEDIDSDATGNPVSFCEDPSLMMRPTTTSWDPEPEDEMD